MYILVNETEILDIRIEDGNVSFDFACRTFPTAGAALAELRRLKEKNPTAYFTIVEQK